MAAKKQKLIAFPVYPGLTPLDLVGPLTVLRNMGRGPYRTVVVGERVEELATDTPLRLRPTATFADVPDPWAVIVPGGGPATSAAMADDALVGYVRAAARGAELVGSTGKGALLLAAADLGRGRGPPIPWPSRGRRGAPSSAGPPATERCCWPPPTSCAESGRRSTGPTGSRWRSSAASTRLNGGSRTGGTSPQPAAQPASTWPCSPGRPGCRSQARGRRS